MAWVLRMDFWGQRVATDGRIRVLVNPTALIGACEIDKIAKFLLPLHSSNAERFLAVVIYKKRLQNHWFVERDNKILFTSLTRSNNWLLEFIVKTNKIVQRDNIVLLAVVALWSYEPSLQHEAPCPSNVDSVCIIAKTTQNHLTVKLIWKRPPRIELWWP